MKPAMCLVMSDVFTLRAYLGDQVRKLAERFELTIVTYADGEADLAAWGVKAEVVHIRIERDISLAKDAAALFRLFLFFRSRRFAIVQSYTPKPGLLSMTAAMLSGVPHRVHWFLGQVWVTKAGLFRRILKLADKATTACSTSILVDSRSQLDFLLREGVVREPKARVILQGSICGVDCERFSPNPEKRRSFRGELGLPEDATVYLYMARFTRDKGAIVMAEAFARFAPEAPKAYLVMVGPDQDGILPGINRILKGVADRVRIKGFTSEPHLYFVASDVLCLPSFREGFGLILINAAAAGIPALASRIYGSTDAVVDGKTGLFHEAGDVGALAGQMGALYRDAGLRRSLGAAGRERVLKHFRQEDVTAAVLEHYASFLE